MSLCCGAQFSARFKTVRRLDLLLKFGERFGWSGPVQEVRVASVVSAEEYGSESLTASGHEFSGLEGVDGDGR
jgi:hypothetical protein